MMSFPTTAAPPEWVAPTRAGLRYPRVVTASAHPSLDVGFSEGSVQLREVYDTYSRLVFAIARKALQPEAANEVTQDVFVNAWRARHQFDLSRGSLKSWLVGITKRRIIDHLRSERRHVDRRADEQAASLAEHPTLVDDLANRSLLVDALQQLPERSQQVITMAFLHDQTHQQIAETTGIPLGTVKSDIRRGLERIRAILVDQEVTA